MPRVVEPDRCESGISVDGADWRGFRQCSCYSVLNPQKHKRFILSHRLSYDEIQKPFCAHENLVFWHFASSYNWTKSSSAIGLTHISGLVTRYTTRFQANKKRRPRNSKIFNSSLFNKPISKNG